MIPFSDEAQAEAEQRLNAEAGNMEADSKKPRRAPTCKKCGHLRKGHPKDHCPESGTGPSGSTDTVDIEEQSEQ